MNADAHLPQNNSIVSWLTFAALVAFVNLINDIYSCRFQLYTVGFILVFRAAASVGVLVVTIFDLIPSFNGHRIKDILKIGLNTTSFLIEIASGYVTRNQSVMLTGSRITIAFFELIIQCFPVNWSMGNNLWSVLINITSVALTAVNVCNTAGQVFAVEAVNDPILLKISQVAVAVGLLVYAIWKARTNINFGEAVPTVPM